MEEGVRIGKEGIDTHAAMNGVREGINVYRGAFLGVYARYFVSSSL